MYRLTQQPRPSAGQGLLPLGLAAQELRDGGCIVDDIGAAQLVYVDLYCPYTTWLAAVHLYKNDVVGETPADDIVKVKTLHSCSTRMVR